MEMEIKGAEILEALEEILFLVGVVVLVVNQLLVQVRVLLIPEEYPLIH